MRLSNFLWLSILSILALAPAAIGQRTGQGTPGPMRLQSFSLRVTVREDGTEMPIASASVSARGRTGSSNSDTTNGAGDCYFPALPGDDYEIFANASGYEGASGTVELLGDTSLILRLRKIPDLNAPGGSTVSVRRLQLPAKAREAYERGLKELYNKHNAEKSLSYFRATLVEAPEFYEAHHQLGMAYDEMGRSQEAENEFREAIRQSDGRFGPAQFSLAAILSGRKDYAAAEEASRKGLAATPQSGVGHYELARALLGQGKWIAAEQEANAALADSRNVPRAYLVLAAIHDQRHEPGKVFHDLTEYLKLLPNGPTSDRMRQRLEEVRKEMEKKGEAGETRASSPGSL
jgi:tetratricopeptide (TPR) repeat protein